MKLLRRVLVPILQYTRWVAVGFLLVLALLLLLVSVSDLYNYYYGFDRAQWAAVGRAFRQQYPQHLHLVDRRQDMVDDLLAHYLAPGMSRKQVVALLGEPDGHYSPPAATSAADLPEMKYYVLYNGSDLETLTITFTPGQQVIRYAAAEK
jgi:hypothetical protein